jgi:hypothetical protein
MNPLLAIRTRLPVSLAKDGDENTNRAKEEACVKFGTGNALLRPNHCGDDSTEYPEDDKFHIGATWAMRGSLPENTASWQVSLQA